MKLGDVIQLQNIKAGGPGSGRHPQQEADDKISKASELAKKYGYETQGFNKMQHPVTGDKLKFDSYERAPKMTGRVRVGGAQPKVDTGFRPSRDSSVTRSNVSNGVVGYKLSVLRDHLNELHGGK